MLVTSDKFSGIHPAFLGHPFDGAGDDQGGQVGGDCHLVADELVDGNLDDVAGISGAKDVVRICTDLKEKNDVIIVVENISQVELNQLKLFMNMQVSLDTFRCYIPENCELANTLIKNRLKHVFHLFFSNFVVCQNMNNKSVLNQ